MDKPLKIGIAGLGTVGAGVVEVLAKHGEMIAARAGRPITVTAVSARDRTRDRGFSVADFQWCDDPRGLAQLDDVDVVCELIGGEGGVAKELVEAALSTGKHVVTANKALLAHHGTALAKQADGAGLALAYEAAVAGGIPIVKGLREGLAANDVQRVYGILNGTCNYILTTMRETGRSFDDVLKDAQNLGYAEADPSFDVDGVDAAHKLAILSALAFGTEVNFDAVHVEGIRHISATDIRFADELGYRIKLLGIAERTSAGIAQRVYPLMVKLDQPIATVEGVFNAVVVEGDFVGTSLFVGRGAGGGPTASAVVADLIDIARGYQMPTFARPAESLQTLVPVPASARTGASYVRLMVRDRPGVIADVAAALRDEDISMEAMLQRGRSLSESVPVVLTTHDAAEEALVRALSQIESLAAVVEPPRMIRIASFA